MKWGFRFKAIAWGVGIDFGTSLVSGLLMGMLFLIFFTFKHPDVPRAELADWLQASVPLKIAGSASGFFCSFLGGMVAAQLAPAFEVRNALVTGLVGVLFSLAAMTVLPADTFYSEKMMIAAYVSTPVAAVLGALTLLYWHRMRIKN